MKPDDIFDALDGISEKYIAETELAVRRHRESRTVQTHTNGGTAEETGRAGSEAGKETAVRQNTTERQTGTDIAAKQPVWQRLATGLAAAAACAVFIGGGWFILQQAKQNPPQDSATYNELDRNFLGGYGEVRIAGNMNLLYDNQSLYLRFAGYEAARSGSARSLMQQRPILNDVYWDGEQFYRTEGTALYRIDNAGNHLDRTPFFTINYSDYQEFFSNPVLDDSQFLEIQKLADGIYFLAFRIETPDDENNRTFSYLYQPETGQQELLLCDDSHEAEIAAYDSNHGYMSCLLGDIFRITYAPFSVECISDDIHVKSGTTNWTAADGNLYFMVNDTTAGNVQGRHDYTPDSYGKIDLETGAYTEIVHEPDFTDFIPYDGKIYVLSGGTKLLCADPEWENVETICDLSRDLPKNIKHALPMSKQDIYATPILHAVDENYIQISCPFQDAPGYLLLDRRTGDFRFFTEN
ncbi:MAG: hypothetical protein J6S92_14905 [Oscillospiraceae bacterium]|nr:hypothetical protein [Oscillospiraceae bacterium]